MAEQKKYFFRSVRAFELLLLWVSKDDDNKSQNPVLKYVIVVLFTFIYPQAISTALHFVQTGEYAMGFAYSLYSVALLVFLHKSFTVAYKNAEINNCIKRLERISSSFGDATDIQKAQPLYNKMFAYGMVLLWISCLTFLIAPFTTSEYRGLPFKPYFSFLNTEKSPNWQLLYVYQFFSVLLLSSAAMAYDTLFCGMLCFSAAVMSCISNEIRALENYMNDHQMLEAKMKKIIDKINKITEIIELLNDIFSATTLTHMVYDCNTLAAGLFMLTYLPLTDINNFTMIGVITMMIFQLWIYCYFGQSVANQKENLATELYNTKWYEASKNFKTMLILMIFESQQSQYIYAGKLMPLSLETFAEVLKKAYAFFSILNNTI